MCEWLYARGANFTLINHWGHGVVVKAAWRGNTDLLQWLKINVAGTTTQYFIEDADGKTPLELAMQRGHRLLWAKAE